MMVVSTSKNINKILTQGFPKKILENDPNFMSFKVSSASNKNIFFTPQNTFLTFRIKQKVLFSSGMHNDFFHQNKINVNHPVHYYDIIPSRTALTHHHPALSPTLFDTISLFNSFNI